MAGLAVWFFLKMEFELPPPRVLFMLCTNPWPGAPGVCDGAGRGAAVQVPDHDGVPGGGAAAAAKGPRGVSHLAPQLCTGLHMKKILR